MKIFVVIAAYNEEKMIEKVVLGVKKYGHEVVVVNDGSRDNTKKIAKTAGAFVLNHEINRGQGAALQTGITYSLANGADMIITFDADDQFLPEEINEIIKPLLLDKVDIVLGSRFLNNTHDAPAKKAAVLKIATWVTNLYTGLKLTDIHNGFRAISAKAARELIITQDGMAHASEILEQIKKHNWRYCEVPVTVKYSEYSMNKGQKLSNSLNIVKDLLISRLNK